MINNNFHASNYLTQLFAMKQLIFRNRYFLIPQLLFLLVGAVLLLVFPKTELHIQINQLHSSLFDVFFKTITYLGSGFIYIPVFLILFNKELKWLIFYLISISGSNVLLLLFKRVIFADVNRPINFSPLAENYQLHLVEGVDMHRFHSFPSGHTTTAFTVFFFLAILSRKNTSKFILFVLALLTAYSRVYLSQHFFEDIVAGSVLGTGTVLFSYYLLIYWQKDWMNTNFKQYIVARKR